MNKTIPFSITGPVIKGNQLGRKLGYPTANIRPDEESLHHHRIGVYAAKAVIGSREYPGMASIGFRPTIPGVPFAIEMHLFDFDEELYDQVITIRFLQKIRQEVRFESLEALTLQMQKDEQVVRALLPDLLQADADTL